MNGLRLTPLALLLTCLVGVTASPLLAGTPRPLVVDMTTLTKVPRVAAIQPFVSSKTPFAPGTYPLISGADPALVDLYRWLYPAGPDQECPLPLPTLPSQLDQARSLVVELELDRALEVLASAWQSLPCQTTPITRDQLRRIFYLEGIVRHYQQDEAGSARAFLDALAVEPSLVPLPGFPPDITDVYLSAAKQLPSLEPVKFEIDPTQRQQGVKIDGLAFPDTEDTLSLLPGRHLAQVLNPAGLARTVTFSVEPGETRPLTELFQIMPPGSASYLSAELRTSLQGNQFSNAQVRAMDAYCRLQNHPFLLFVVVRPDSPGELAVVSYTPGKGLSRDVPEGLEPLPPMNEAVAEASDDKGKPEKRRGKKEEQAEEEKPARASKPPKEEEKPEKVARGSEEESEKPKARKPKEEEPKARKPKEEEEEPVARKPVEEEEPAARKPVEEEDKPVARKPKEEEPKPRKKPVDDDEDRPRRRVEDDDGLAEEFDKSSKRRKKPADDDPEAAFEEAAPARRPARREEDDLGFEEGGGRRPREDREEAEDTGPAWVARLELGGLGYAGDTFSSITPSITRKLAGGLGFQVALTYASDMGLRTEGMFSMAGLRLGPEFALELDLILARAGLGAELLAARVTEVDGARVLSLEGTPVFWLGGEYLITDTLRAGITAVMGYGPGVVGPEDARLLWRASAGVSISF